MKANEARSIAKIVFGRCAYYIVHCYNSGEHWCQQQSLARAYLALLPVIRNREPAKIRLLGLHGQHS